MADTLEVGPGPDPGPIPPGHFRVNTTVLPIAPQPQPPLTADQLAILAEAEEALGLEGFRWASVMGPAAQWRYWFLLGQGMRDGIQPSRGWLTVDTRAPQRSNYVHITGVKL